MSFIAILKIISYVAVFAVPTVIGIVNKIKTKNKHKKDLQRKDNTIGQLRKVITEMVELEGDKKDVDIQKKQIKKNIDSMSDDDFGIIYANQLPNMPGKSRRRKNKKS